jgi:hypothetical protein
MGSFNSLEQNDTLQKIGQADGAYNRELQYMDGMLMDWATRDNSYAYMDHPLASYLEQNMGDEVFVSQNLDLIIMADEGGGHHLRESLRPQEQDGYPPPGEPAVLRLRRQPVPHERHQPEPVGRDGPAGRPAAGGREAHPGQQEAWPAPRHDDPGEIHRRGLDRYAFRVDTPEPVRVPLRRPGAAAGPGRGAERLGVERHVYHPAPGRRQHRRLPGHR